MSLIREAADRARAWLFDTALPLWAERGVDPDGAFYERLDLDGTPDAGAIRRTRVQARQIYAFAEADALGWPGPGLAIARRGAELYRARAFEADGRPGWAHTLHPDGTIADPMRDAYDHAFALFGLAALYARTGDAQWADLARRTVAYLDEALADPLHGGYRESDPPVLPRRANPHMHLLEAFLAWHETTGEAHWLVRSEAILSLFHDRFFDRETRTLTEFFTDDWRRAPGAKGRVVEPGHHFEWSWLLLRAERQGARNSRPEAEALYDTATAAGLDARGYAVDEIDVDGRVRDGARRLWPQTELIKAHLAMAELGRPGAAEAGARVALQLFDDYLAVSPAGAWMNRFSEAGEPFEPCVPASTFYHLMVAFRELIRFAERDR